MKTSGNMIDFGSILGAVNGMVEGENAKKPMLGTQLQADSSVAFDSNVVNGKSVAGKNKPAVDGMGKGIDSAMQVFSTAAPMIGDISKGKGDRMNERGVTTHKANIGGKALSMAATGAQIAGPWGALVGGAVGAGLGFLDKSKQPSQADEMRQNDKFNMGLHTKTLISNDTLPEQVQPAKYGMKYANGTKLIEVEKDEVVLRKIGKAFKKVADFKGGKTHNQGGEPYIAEEGDIIVPGKKRLLVDQALRTRNWTRLESIRQSLPTDKAPQNAYPDGTDGVHTKPKPNPYSKIHLPRNADPLRQQELQLAYASAKKLSTDQLEGFRNQQTSDSTYYANKDKYIADYTTKWMGEQTNHTPNSQLSQTTPEYKAMAEAREKTWYDNNKREINPVVQNYYKTGPAGFNANQNIRSDMNLQGPSGMLVSTELPEYEEGTSGVKTETSSKKAERWSKFLSQEGIKEKVMAIAKKHGFTPEELMAVMDYETGYTLDPKVASGNSTAVGLIQFIESTAKDLGTSTQELKAMDSLSQLKYVDKYFEKNHKKGEHPYITVAAPAMAGKPDSDVVYPKGSKEATSNPSWQDKDGNVTKASIKSVLTETEPFKDFATSTESSEVPFYIGTEDQEPKPKTVEEARAMGPNPATREEENAAIQAEIDRDAYLESLVQSEKAIINNATPTGKKIREEYEKSMAKDVAAMDKVLPANEIPKWAQIGHEDDDWGITTTLKDFWNKMPSKVKRGIASASVDYGGDRSSRWGEGAQETRFSNTSEGKALSKDAVAFHEYLQEQIKFFPKVGVELGEFLAFVPKVVFGKTLESSDMRIDADIVSAFTPEEYKALIEEAKDKGIISGDYSEAYAYDLYKNPERYYTTQDDAQLALDAATILNPKGLFQVGKTAFKAGKTVAKGTVKGTVATAKGAKQAYTWTKDNWKVMLKKAPGLAKKALNNTIDFLSDKPMYKEGETVFSTIDDITAGGSTLRGTRKATYDKIKTQFTRAGKFMKDIPSKMREQYYGKSLDDILQAEEDILKHTGKSWDEVSKMSKEEIGTMFKDMHQTNLNKYKNAVHTENEAWANYWKAHKKVYGDEGEELLQLGTPEAVEAQKALRSAEQNLLESTAESTRLKPDSKIILGSEEDMLKYTNDERAFQTKVNGYMESQRKAMDKIQNPDEFQLALREQKAKSNPSWSSNQLGDGGAMAKAEAKKLAEEGVLARDAKDLAKKTLDDNDAFAKKFPDVANALKKDEVLRGHFRRGVGRGAATLDMLLRSGVPKDKADAFIRDFLPEEGETTVDIEPETPTEETASTVDMTPIPRPEFPEPVETGAKPIIGEKDSKGSGVLSKIGGGLETLAGYAPAIYNIMRGLEKPEEIRRRFVRPQTMQYENMSQPQLNAIDTAFNASLSNARNNSGGLMANFRSNTESAWADKIARTAQVNQQEVARSYDIANQNVGIRNQAEQINTQTHQQADIMDLQSEAATKSFLGQGMQDVANISSRNKTDRMAASNQEFLKEMVSSGRDFTLNPDGTVAFKGPNTRTSIGAKTNPFLDVTLPEITPLMTEKDRYNPFKIKGN